MKDSSRLQQLLFTFLPQVVARNPDVLRKAIDIEELLQKVLAGK